MLSRLKMSVALLAVVILCGVGNIMVTKAISERYVAAAEELRVLADQEHWQRTGETAQGYHQTWRETLGWLQMLIHHGDGDEVSRALGKIEAGVQAEDRGMCLEGCAELHEAAEHVYHRDAFTWGNIL